MRKILLFIMVVALQLTTTANRSRAESMTGIWKFDYSSAPYDYQEGLIVIRENNTIGIKFKSGEIKASNIKVTDKKTTFSVEVDGESVGITLKQEANKLISTINSSLGVENISLNRVAKSSSRLCGKYSVNSGAPYPYNRGVLNIDKKGDTYTAIFTAEGTDMPLSNITQNGNSIKGNINVEGSYFTVTLTETTYGLKGKSSDGYGETFQITAQW